MRLGEREGLTYINGYDHPNVIAGAGTLGMEILEQVRARTPATAPHTPSGSGWQPALLMPFHSLRCRRPFAGAGCGGGGGACWWCRPHRWCGTGHQDAEARRPHHRR